MPLNKEQADRIREEALFQGWEADRRESSKGDWMDGYGRVWVHEHRDAQTKEKLGTCTVEFHWPALSGPEYYVTEPDEWRRLKAKVDEIRQIVEEAKARGWIKHEWDIVPKKQGKVGMTIEVNPPGGRYYGYNVGGMRTWKKLLREFGENIIEGSVHTDPEVIEP